ncbi:MAG: RagB/SusD family nutrient uptake outer membrane protein, partial [Prevotella sp.]|nr:RagB/SusD family nutrient uptake outer membrane protein [Prevotella sp.]
MKTNKYNKVYVLLCTALFTFHYSLFTSCSDYLDVEPTNAIRTGSFYSTESQVNDALTGLYGSLKVLPTYMFTMSEMRSDNTWITADVKQNDYVDIATFNANGLLTANMVKNCWADYYTTIASANTLLDKMEDVAFADEDVKNQYRAEARF